MRMSLKKINQGFFNVFDSAGRSTVLPSDGFINYLRQRKDCQIFELSEHYQPSSQSMHLTSQRSALVNQQSFSKQYLVRAQSSFGLFSASGLLWLDKKRLVYELNYSNLQNLIHHNSVGTDLLKHLYNKILRRKAINVVHPPGWYGQFPDKRNYSQSITLASTHNNPNYFHWLSMPGQSSIFLEELFTDSECSASPVIITESSLHQTPPWVPEIFEITIPNRSIELVSSAQSSASTSFSIQQLHTPVALSPKQLLWLRKKVNAVVNPKLVPKDLIFVSRGSASQRSCINEAEIYAILQPLGFQWHSMDNLPVIEQLNLFRRASCIVSPHGAALSNLIACFPKTALLELMPGYGDFSHYFMMCDVLDLKHAHIIGKCIDSRKGSFCVEPSDVFMLVSKLIKSLDA